MKKILTFGFVALMTAATVTASAVPASAGGNGHGNGWHSGQGGHGWHGRHSRHRWHRWDRRIYFGHGNPWHAHVRWCQNRHRSYDASTNMFLTSRGHWRHCRSPFR